MGDLVSISEARQKRTICTLAKSMQEWYDTAHKNTLAYRQIVSENLEEAINLLPEFLSRERAIAPGGLGIEPFAGGPNQDWTAPLLDALGDAYTGVDRRMQEKILQSCLSYLDGLRYDYSQNHVEMINEPWLCRDIIINRTMYSPGFIAYRDQLAANHKWSDVAPLVEKARSKFWFTMAIMKNEPASLEVRHKFRITYPILLDRSLDALAAFKHVSEQTRDEAVAGYDPLLHERIHAKMEEKSWVIL